MQQQIGLFAPESWRRCQTCAGWHYTAFTGATHCPRSSKEVAHPLLPASLSQYERIVHMLHFAVAVSPLVKKVAFVRFWMELEEGTGTPWLGIQALRLFHTSRRNEAWYMVATGQEESRDA